LNWRNDRVQLAQWFDRFNDRASMQQTAPVD
jgi:hypothetical protein